MQAETGVYGPNEVRAVASRGLQATSMPDYVRYFTYRGGKSKKPLKTSTEKRIFDAEVCKKNLYDPEEKFIHADIYGIYPNI
mgnify:CR=1 FL=1